MIRGIAHICFVVKDIKLSVRFYRDGLGLTLSFEMKNGQMVYLNVGGRNFLELSQIKEVIGPPCGSYNHFCLEVDDIESAAETIRSRGIEVTPVKLGGDKSKQAWLTDPDGNRIELHQYTDDSLQMASLHDEE